MHVVLSDCVAVQQILRRAWVVVVAFQTVDVHALNVSDVLAQTLNGVTLFVEHFNARQAHVVWVTPRR